MNHFSVAWHVAGLTDSDRVTPCVVSDEDLAAHDRNAFLQRIIAVRHYTADVAPIIVIDSVVSLKAAV